MPPLCEFARDIRQVRAGEIADETNVRVSRGYYTPQQTTPMYVAYTGGRSGETLGF